MKQHYSSSKKSERKEENKLSGELLHLTLPKYVRSKKERISKIEKTSLYVPTEKLITKQNGFRLAKFSKDVFVSKDIGRIFKTIFKYGDFANRYGKNCLEEDPSRLQIIIYALILCQGNLLCYQRADSSVVKGILINEPRLKGRISVGFAGHNTREDMVASQEDLAFFTPLLPGIKDEVGLLLGLNNGMYKEVLEELNIQRQNIKSLEILGGFYDKRISDPDLKTQTGSVHFGILSVLEIDPSTTTGLTLRRNEIAKAWWVPFRNISRLFQEYDLKFKAERGPRVEPWTEVVLNVYWPLIMKKYKK